jgi:integrase
MFNLAIQRGALEFNPAHNTPRSPERSRDRRLNDTELHALWTALEFEPLGIAALFKLALLTAARRSELLQMAWAEIDLGWWTLPATRSKGNREHRIPLSASAISLLKEVRAGSSGDFVFPGRRPRVRTGSTAFASATASSNPGVSTISAGPWLPA